MRLDKSPLDDQWGNNAAFKMSYAFGTGSDRIVETGCAFDENFGCDVAPVFAAFSTGHEYHQGSDLIAFTGGVLDNLLGGDYVPPISRRTAYEPLRDLVTGVSNFWDGVRVSSHVYKNDALGRRIARDDSHGQGPDTENAFVYNARSEVTNAAMGGTTYSYAYDPIGNRTESAVAVGNGQPDVAAYGANILNQYSAVTNSANSASPREIVPVYDDDGNMTSYGPWTYTWDGENRMSSACSNNVLLVTNVYDHMSRRIGKEVYVWNSQASAYSLQSSASFLWNGWNVIREIMRDSGAAFTNYYTWGLDLILAL